MKKCIFCNKKKHKIVYNNRYFYVLRDTFPVTKNHTLIIPKKHMTSFFDLNNTEIISLFDVLKKQRIFLTNKDKTIKSFNIGINNGKYAGQTIMHLHVHLIPRRKGDVKNPRGGVRGVIPSKQKY